MCLTDDNHDGGEQAAGSGWATAAANLIRILLDIKHEHSRLNHQPCNNLVGKPSMLS